MGNNLPEVKIHRLENDLIRAVKLIEKFLTINKIELKYSITLDYKLEGAYGEWDPKKKTEIVLNPSAFYNNSKEKPWAKGYSEDYSLMGVAIHEFNHMLLSKFNLENEYDETFPKSFYINENCRNDRREELCEIFSLYILNPYFLKLINPERFNFCKKLFESPTPCTKSAFISRWRKWSPQIHQICLEKWGIKVLGNRVFKE